MIRGAWRGLLNGGIAGLLLFFGASPTMAQSADHASSITSAAPAKPVKITPPKTSALKTATSQASKKIAAGKAKQPSKIASLSKKTPAAKKIVTVAKKPTSPAKIAATGTPAAPASASAHVTTVAPAPALATEAKTAVGAKPTAPPLASTAAHVATATPAPTPAAEARTAAVPISLSLTVDAPRPVGLPASATNTAADPKTAAAFVSGFLSEAFRIAKLPGANSLQRRAQLAELFADKIDMKRIAGYTAADELTGKSADIQQRFRTILVSYMVETYYPQLETASSPGVRVDTAPVEPLADGTAVVWTTFTKDGWGSQSVKWYVAAEAGHYKVVDIFTAGASLVQMERDTFRSVMRDGGLITLMAKLDARTRELASAATE
jgi:ABC-type transporter MlaC component